MKPVSLLLFSVIFLFSGCYFLKPKFHKIHAKEDFYLYKHASRDKASLIKFNGVYQNAKDSLIGFYRFYPDGKVVSGGCYGDFRNMTLNECYDNGKKISLNGYYMVRHDTLFLEMSDNVPISNGINYYLYRIHSDTLKALVEFNRSKLTRRNLDRIPSANDLSVRYQRVFIPLNLRDSIKKDW
jgi:hypothetical protein